ncbi:DUF397 domain-containing protein [Streptomyces sp. NPDC056061]|uniref:DUF397 domain-containing protein n=1 Tax=Streptomyces sp. NPDC056061 TaxID=3345700 RepID=UPI0035E112C8
MPKPLRQKSAYFGAGESCVHVAAPAPGAVRPAETGDPAGTAPRASPTAALKPLVRAPEESPAHD